MVMIKEMNIPNRCKECKFCLRQRTNEYGSFGECLLQKDKKVNCLAWSRDDDCPLVEIVTCKDCKYNMVSRKRDENVCTIDGCTVTDNYFCECAERRK